MQCRCMYMQRSCPQQAEHQSHAQNRRHPCASRHDTRHRGVFQVCSRRLPCDFCAPIVRYGYACKCRYGRCGAKIGQHITEHGNLLIACRPCAHTEIPGKAVLAGNIVADSVGGKERTAVDIVDRAAGAAAFRSWCRPCPLLYCSSNQSQNPY